MQKIIKNPIFVTSNIFTKVSKVSCPISIMNGYFAGLFGDMEIKKRSFIDQTLEKQPLIFNAFSLDFKTPV